MDGCCTILNAVFCLINKVQLRKLRKSQKCVSVQKWKEARLLRVEECLICSFMLEHTFDNGSGPSPNKCCNVATQRGSRIKSIALLPLLLCACNRIPLSIFGVCFLVSTDWVSTVRQRGKTTVIMSFSILHNFLHGRSCHGTAWRFCTGSLCVGGGVFRTQSLCSAYDHCDSVQEIGVGSENQTPSWLCLPSANSKLNSLSWGLSLHTDLP